MIMESHSGAELAREALTGCPRTDDLVLAVSELASNAVIHSASGQGGTFTIRLRTAPRWARVEITDGTCQLLVARGRLRHRER